MKTTANSHHPATEQNHNLAQGGHLTQCPVGFTEAEAAGYLGLKVYTLRKWRREGSGPEYIRCGARLIRYMQADINGWLVQRKFHSNAHELSVMLKE